MRGQKNLTQGPILRNLLLFAFPMMLGNMLQQMYNIVDTMIVGHFVDSNALAAVGSAYTLMTFLTSVIIGLCMGSGALFSEAFGAKDVETYKWDARASFLFIGGVTFVLTLLVMLFRRQILMLMQVPAEVFEILDRYAEIVFLGLGFLFLYNYFAYLLRGMGNSVIPLLFLGASSILNIVLDCYFVMGLEKGVAGAAWATVISQGVAGVGISVYGCVTCKELLFGANKTAKDIEEIGDGRAIKDIRRSLGRLVKNDLLTCLQQSIMNFGILMIQGLVNSFGPVIMAAFAAAVKIDTLAYMPAQEFGNAYSLYISQNYGAGKEDRIRRGSKIAMGVSTGFCMIISGIIWILGEWFMRFFVKAQETEIIAAGVDYLRIEGSFYFGIGILFLLYGYYRGIQKAQMSLVLTVISLGTRVGLAYLLAPRGFGVEAIWWAIPIGWFLADAVGLLYKRKNYATTIG